MTHPTLQVAICGAHGYSGQVLVQQVLQHPHLHLAGVFSRRDPTQTRQQLPLLARHQILIWPMAQFNEQIANVDIVLLATPPATSMELVNACAKHSVNVIDLSGAFRLPVNQFEHWYQMPHTATEALTQAVYGLQPWHQTRLKQSPSLIANPGCYATAALMALLPLIEHFILQNDSIIIDAKSGASGAGRRANESLLFCEIADNFYPYKIGQHQHTPEIQHILTQQAQTPVHLTLTTHLLPIVRGISLTIYAQAHSQLNDDHTIEQAIAHAYQQAYQHYPLVTTARLNPQQPQQHLLNVNQVTHTPNTHIVYSVQQRRIIVVVSLDNLLKGAASQAIENLNALYGFPLTTGLLTEGVLS